MTTVPLAQPIDPLARTAVLVLASDDVTGRKRDICVRVVRLHIQNPTSHVVDSLLSLSAILLSNLISDENTR